jgi:vacuolar-type H+-ATPase catalytic subunit A/Vma1
MSDSTGATDSVRNEAINLKKKADNTDRLKEISEELNDMLAELNNNDTVFV